jgi:hypothetical protein
MSESSGCLCAILRAFGLAGGQEITVVEDSANDNGYLTGKAQKNAGCLRATSKEDMVEKVLQRLGACNCIKVLKLVGHGSPGNISVGDGQGWETCKHINGNRDEWEKPLSKLKGRFCKDAKILLIGCNVGACDAGASKLQELADFFGVTVEAPTGKTYGDCTEEAGSEHQIATPGGHKPEHKSSPSDQKKEKEKDKKPERGGGVLFKVEEIRSIAIHPAQLISRLESPRQAAYTYSDEEGIRRFLSGIDATRAINAEGLGADFNAYVFIEFANGSKEYVVCSDFDYFLEKGNWKSAYEVTWNLKEELRAIVHDALRGTASR